MLDDESGPAASEQTTDSTSESPAPRRAVSRPAGPPRTTFSAAEPPESPNSGPRISDTATTGVRTAETGEASSPFAVPLFRAPDPVRAKPAPEPEQIADRSGDSGDDDADDDDTENGDGDSDAARGDETSSRRRRRRGGRRRRRGGDDGDNGSSESDASGDDANDDSSEEESPASSDDADQSNGSESDDEAAEGGRTTRRRRRRRRRGEESSATSDDDPENTVTKVRERRSAEDEITSVTGSTRLEAKKQRRREGREAGRRRAPIVTESEFLARRESVKREMVIRQREELSQIAVLEDDVLVEHYVARESQTSMIGNVYLGRVQNVLPSMEAAFIDIGKGRNGVLYAGEVDWKALGDGKPRKIEEALTSGQTVLVQVTKDPVGHKGARLTSQISLAGRFLVYVPGGQANGISRKLPDTERNRLKGLLKDVLPEEAGVIIRTAAEGATEEQLNRDVTALTARWDDIQAKTQKGNAPQLLYAEPDLMIKVVRDLFNEDFARLTVQGGGAWDMIEGYVQHVAPDLADRLERWGADDAEDDTRDVFAAYRIDEQIAKATDRKVWLPSGGSLIIDRTEAMTVIDVNTGKFTGSGGNLEETVTKNNLEAAEEIVRQLRLRDIGGIIVIDFIDMVLENNRELVLRRLVECLGRDRTRHQVAEVTSLGLVQMTRKRIGTGLVEAFSESCDHCHGRGLIVHADPVEPRKQPAEESRRRRGGRGKNADKGSEKSGDKASDKGSEKSEKGSDKGTDSNGDEHANKSDKPAKQSGSKRRKSDTAKSAGPGGDTAAAEPTSDSGDESTQAQPSSTETSGTSESPRRRRSGRGGGKSRGQDSQNAAHGTDGTDTPVTSDQAQSEETPAEGQQTPPADQPTPAEEQAAAVETPAAPPPAEAAAVPAEPELTSDSAPTKPEPTAESAPAEPQAVSTDTAAPGTGPTGAVGESETSGERAPVSEQPPADSETANRL